MSALIEHPEWKLAKAMAKDWHPLAQFNIFVSATGLPWFGLFVHDEAAQDAQDKTITAFAEFCAKWQPELEKRGIQIAD